MPLFSVVIPTYNRVDLLFKSVRSALNQSCDNYEIIVVDDGSSADVVERIKPLAGEDKVKLILCPDNKGGGAARNIGIKEAKGEYICFLDSDDIWHADKLKEEKAVIESLSQVDIVYSQMKNIKEGKVIEVVPKVGITDDQLLSDYLFFHIKGGRGMPTPTLVVKAEIAKRTLFDDELRGHQDWDFLLRISPLRPKVFFIEKCLTYRYLKTEGESHDNVSLGLGYDFSKKFYRDRVKYLSFKSRIFFHTRILLVKSITEKKEIFRNIFYLGNLFDMPFVLKKAFRMIAKRQENQRQY